MQYVENIIKVVDIYRPVLHKYLTKYKEGTLPHEMQIFNAKGFSLFVCAGSVGVSMETICSKSHTLLFDIGFRPFQTEPRFQQYFIYDTTISSGPAENAKYNTVNAKNSIVMCRFPCTIEEHFQLSTVHDMIDFNDLLAVQELFCSFQEYNINLQTVALHCEDLDLHIKFADSILQI